MLDKTVDAKKVNAWKNFSSVIEDKILQNEIKSRTLNIFLIYMPCKFKKLSSLLLLKIVMLIKAQETLVQCNAIKPKMLEAVMIWETTLKMVLEPLSA